MSLLSKEDKKDLLPCPFCGSMHIKYFGTNGDSLYCRNCNAEGPGSFDGTLEGAIKEWNGRNIKTPEEIKKNQKQIVNMILRKDPELEVSSE